MPKYASQRPAGPSVGHVDKALIEAVSVADAARRAGVSRTLLYDVIGRGELPTIKLGKRRLVRLEALRHWLKSLETRAA